MGVQCPINVPKKGIVGSRIRGLCRPKIGRARARAGDGALSVRLGVMAVALGKTGGGLLQMRCRLRLVISDGGALNLVEGLAEELVKVGALFSKEYKL